MNLSVAQIIAAHTALTGMIEANHASVPMRGRFLIARTHAALQHDVELAEQHRQQLVKDMGEEVKDETGAVTGWAVPTLKMADFQNQWRELALCSVEVEVKPIPLSLMGNSITAMEMRSLVPLIDSEFVDD